MLKATWWCPIHGEEDSETLFDLQGPHFKSLRWWFGDKYDEFTHGEGGCTEYSVLEIIL